MLCSFPGNLNKIDPPTLLRLGGMSRRRLVHFLEGVSRVKLERLSRGRLWISSGECLGGVSKDCHGGVSRGSVSGACLGGVSRGSFSGECLGGVSRGSVLGEFLGGVSRGSVSNFKTIFKHEFRHGLQQRVSKRISRTKFKSVFQTNTNAISTNGVE